MGRGNQRLRTLEEGFTGRCPPCLLGHRRVTRRSASPKLHKSLGNHASQPAHRTGRERARSGRAAPDHANQADFGANEWLVEELYQRYLADPGSVDRAWWSFFADYQPTLPSGTGPQPVLGLQGAPPAPAPQAVPVASPPRRPVRSAAPAAGSAPGGRAPPQRPAAARSPAQLPPRPSPAAPRARLRLSPEPSSAFSPEPSSAFSPKPTRRHRGQQAARRRGAHRHQHDGQPGRAHRDQRPRGPGQAARGQPDRHQQPPAARPGRQGVVHAPHRVRGGRGAEGAAGDERRLRRGERQARHRQARPRQPGAGHRRAQRRRRQAAARAEHQGGGGDGLPPVLDDLRGRRAPGARGQARGHRLPGHHRDDHQPRHDRHRALGAAADGGPGLHRGRRGDGVPGRLRRGVRGNPGPAGDQQVGHAHLDL